MKTLKSILFAGAVLLATSLFFGSCQEDAPEINYQMNVNVNNDFSQVVKAINDGLLKNEQAIDRLKQAIDNMNGDQKAKLEAIEKVLASMTDSLNTKLLVIEAAIKSQSMELSLKLEAIERAINNLPRYNDVFNGIKDEIANLVQAVKDGNKSEKEALDEIIQKLEELKAAIDPDSKSPYVDLGLQSGLKWAKCNLGASKPSEIGDLYAWGETEPKEEYTWQNYKWNANPNLDTWKEIKKYTFDDGRSICRWYDGEGNFIGDSITIIQAEDDAATQKLGEPWRMPTSDDFKELIDKCTWTWTMQDGVNGYEVRGANGNSIFLPADSSSDNGYTRYWSSSLGKTSDVASSLSISQDEYKMLNDQPRRYGYLIRPVRNDVPTNN